MNTEQLTLWLRIANAVLALSVLPLFSALATYHRQAIKTAAPTVAKALMGLVAAVAVSSAWRAANGPVWVPSLVLFVALVCLVGASLRDLRNRRTP